MIDWKDPRVESPISGRVVGMLVKHPKRNTHMNCEIFFGEAHYTTDNSGNWAAFTNDETGQGASMYHGRKNGDSNFDHCQAWFYAEEMNLPDWIGDFI